MLTTRLEGTPSEEVVDMLASAMFMPSFSRYGGCHSLLDIALPSYDVIRERDIINHPIQCSPRG
jgi:hypothetical protein